MAGTAEFQKIIGHPGIVMSEPIGALAHLGLGRAYAMSGDVTKAKAAYQNFLTLWKDADPDIPILKQAKAEYAKLQYSFTTCKHQRRAEARLTSCSGLRTCQAALVAAILCAVELCRLNVRTTGALSISDDSISVTLGYCSR